MILDTIAESTRKRVKIGKEKVSPEMMMHRAMNMPKGEFNFEKQLIKPGISFICEVKKASPSKGIIAEDFPYVQIAKEYEEAGAAAISVLTEPEFFMGSSRYLTEIHQAVSIPLLRKDFVIDEYQLYEAKCIGASAALLICSLLDEETLKYYIKICDQLGLSALVEAHSDEEVLTAIRAGARIIGINNRNLKNFQVDFGNAVRLRKMVPPEVLFVAESGIKNASDIKLLEEAKVNAVLIGETLMRAADKKAALAELRKGCLVYD
ncbi:indole-3-glycerol phosphate synthase TrpC [Clostridium sp. chh4-2]|uniref:indole-3-glycerol phosphate synthase TrpC n=1 Tax=Clostridium sp. chh4-2 TaxID=2067550 RepID=UPI000CCED13D|nr:indole-3-glycerol phosphate synthase TrpC [Clostridium sp. chh4-2]PNV63293.1 indole-3-glycerol phosphate synthase TrpC [Clostridium sp. chh4-2]